MQMIIPTYNKQRVRRVVRCFARVYALFDKSNVRMICLPDCARMIRMRMPLRQYLLYAHLIASKYRTFLHIIVVVVVPQVRP